MKNATLALTTLLLSFGTAAAIATPVEEIWTAQCAKCHGADGAGKTVIGKKLKLKDYTDATVQTAMKDEDIAKAIKSGVTENGKERMKAFADLTDEEVTALTAHIRAMKK